MARFTLPRDLYFGPGAMEELKNLKGYKKAFIVTGGSSMKKTGFLQKLEDILKAAGLQTRLYDGVEPDPSIERVYDGAKAMREFEPGRRCLAKQLGVRPGNQNSLADFERN